ncbi:hypothetical protein A2U01_0079613, partial [Trifolium medium]|nr:hypothetical protein [Trifolium medium]
DGGLQLQHRRDDILTTTTIWFKIDGCSPEVQDPTSYPILLPAVSSAGRPTGPLSETDYEAARASDAYSERMGPGV